MKKIGNLEGKPIVTNEFAPNSKDVIWKDPSDEKFKESIDGEWADSPKIPSGGEDSFPYEYYCPDDFSVVVNPEDWNDDDYPYAEISIPASLQVPENYKLILGSCNNVLYVIEEHSFYVFIEQGKKHYTISVRIDFDQNIFYIMQMDTFDPFEVGPITLNFKDFFFLGNKKEQ
jgi:hypothetical protein